MQTLTSCLCIRHSIRFRWQSFCIFSVGLPASENDSIRFG